VSAFKADLGQHSDFTTVLHYRPKVLDRVLVQNDPINNTDPYGLAPAGFNWFTWAVTRGVVGTLTGVPLTVGQGIGLFGPGLAGNPDWKPFSQIQEEQRLAELLEEYRKLNEAYDELCRMTGGCDNDPCD